MRTETNRRETRALAGLRRRAPSDCPSQGRVAARPGRLDRRRRDPRRPPRNPAAGDRRRGLGPGGSARPRPRERRARPRRFSLPRPARPARLPRGGPDAGGHRRNRRRLHRDGPRSPRLHRQRRRAPARRRPGPRSLRRAGGSRAAAPALRPGREPAGGPSPPPPGGAVPGDPRARPRRGHLRRRPPRGSRTGGVAPERIAAEMSKLLASPRSAPALRWAARAGLLPAALGLDLPRARAASLARSLALLDDPATRRLPEGRRRQLRLAWLALRMGFSEAKTRRWLQERRWSRRETDAAARLTTLAATAKATAARSDAWRWVVAAGSSGLRRRASGRSDRRRGPAPGPATVAPGESAAPPRRRVGRRRDGLAFPAAGTRGRRASRGARGHRGLGNRHKSP